MKCEICTKEFDSLSEDKTLCKSCEIAKHNKWLMEGGIDAYTKWKRFQSGYQAIEKEQHAVLDEAYADGREGGEG